MKCTCGNENCVIDLEIDIFDRTIKTGEDGVGKSMYLDANTIILIVGKLNSMLNHMFNERG